MKIDLVVAGTKFTIDGDDVLAWARLSPKAASDARVLATESAGDYVAEHPRPEPDAQGAVNIPSRQRTALLRRLARGPASKAELLAAMRSVGYVGGDDWRNRMDELRGHGKRGNGHTPLPIEISDDGQMYRLTETFAALTDADRADLARAKGALNALPGLADRGRMLLEELLPEVGASDVAAPAVTYPSADVLRTFDEAMREGLPVRLEYRPQDRPLTIYPAVLPRHYLSGDTALRAFVVKLNADGSRDSGRQLALDRIVKVEINHAIIPSTTAAQDPSEALTLWLTRPLAAVLSTRELFDLDVSNATPVGPDFDGLVEVTGRFNPELSWEVLRVLLTWAGAVQVVAPDWLAASFAARCLDGLLAQISHVDPRESATYPQPDDHDAGQRLESLDELAGVLQEARDRLRPPDDGPQPKPGHAKRVLPPQPLD